MTYKEERRKHWEEVMEEWKASGLSGAAFCREKRCSKANFFRWKKKFSDETSESSVFMPVSLSSSGGLRIMVGDDIEIKFSSCTDGFYLGKIVNALQKVC